MKKILAMALVLLAFSCSAFASDIEDLERAERAVVGMLDALDGEPVPSYAELKKDISAQMQIMWGESEYKAMREGVAAKYGRMMSASFYAFERTEDLDRLFYLGQFTKEREALVIFALNKEGAILAYGFKPHKRKPVVNERITNWRITK